MSSLGDLANWWDRQHEISEEILNQFVDDHPNWFGIAVATTASTTMTLGAGLVDVLRLGEGVSEGGVKGFASDGLRLLQIAPGVGQLSRLRIARVMKNPGGDICTWVTAAKALRHVSAKESVRRKCTERRHSSKVRGFSWPMALRCLDSRFALS